MVRGEGEGEGEGAGERGGEGGCAWLAKEQVRARDVSVYGYLVYYYYYCLIIHLLFGLFLTPKGSCCVAI